MATGMQPSDGSGRRNACAEAAAVVIIAAVCCLFFWRAVTLRGVFFHYDHALQNFPYRHFFAEGLRRGEFRLWNGDMFCGFPLFAESQSNAAYPPFVALFLLLPSWVAYNYYTVLHFLLAGASTYLLARVMHVGRAGAVLAGICYMLAAPLLFHAHHTNIVVGISYLPLLLALAELACRRRTAGPLLAFGAVTALLILGSQPQYTLYGGLVCGLFLLWRLALMHRAAGRARPAVALGLGFGLAAALALMLSAVQVLPLVELVGLSSRAGGATWGPNVMPNVPGTLITALLPRYFGAPGLGSYWGHLGVGLHSELTLYCGVAPLLLAIVGALSDRRRSALFFAALGVFAFIFSLGFAGSLYNIFGPLPVFSSTRFPQRFAYVTALCIAMLAGMGLEQLLATGRRARPSRAALASAGVVLVLTVAVLAAVGAFNGELRRLGYDELATAIPVLPPDRLRIVWTHLHHTLPADVWHLVGTVTAGTGLLLLSSAAVLPRRAVTALWCGLVFVELTLAGWDFAPVTDPELYRDPPPIVRRLKELQQVEPGRIYRHGYFYLGTASGPEPAGPSAQGWAIQPSRYARCLDTLPHSTNMLWGVPAVSGFCPLQTRALKTLLGRPDARSTVIEFGLSPPLDLLGARYILTPWSDLPPKYEFVERIGATNIYRNPDAMPRSFIVHHAAAAPDPDAAVAGLRNDEFDYAGLVLLHGTGRPPPAVGAGRQDPDETVEVTDGPGDTISVRARLSRPGYLVLAEQHYPGWRVAVDGGPAELLRVDYALMGVRLEPGDHAVRFTFAPASCRKGLVLTLAALLMLAAGVAWAARCRAPLPGQEAPEDGPLVDCPYSAHGARLAITATVLFLLLGPMMRPGTWRKVPVQLDPRSYAVRYAGNSAWQSISRDRPVEACETLLAACRWWPSPPCRRLLVWAAGQATQSLIEDGRSDEALRLAAEVSALAPEETMNEPQLAGMALVGRRRRDAPRDE